MLRKKKKKKKSGGFPGGSVVKTLPANARAARATRSLPRGLLSTEGPAQGQTKLKIIIIVSQAKRQKDKLGKLFATFVKQKTLALNI